MSPVKNGRLLFNAYPDGNPEPGKHTVYDDTSVIDLDNVPLNGGFLVKTLSLSIDPYLRFRMRDPSHKEFVTSFKIGEPIESHGIGIVLRSEANTVATGDHITGYFPHQEYFVGSQGGGFTVVKNAENIPWSAYIGVLGMPGLTAYCGWKKFARPKAGDKVFVTTAAGPVGATVVQLAKAEGLYVIASVGSQAKADFAKSLGADVVFNYKEQKTSDVLAAEGPINIYWDHVGGEAFDAFLENAADGALIIACGSISSYNGALNPIYKHSRIFERCITIHGFLAANLIPTYSEAFYEEIPKLIAAGKMKYLEHVTKGLENGGHALSDVLLGRNIGKSVVLVAEE